MPKSRSLKRFWRSRTALIAAAFVLAGVAATAIWYFLRKPDGPCCYYQEIITDGRVHPLHLTYPDGREGMFDLVCVTNHSKYPLALMAFSARPHTKEDLRHPGRVMAKWAAWILRSKAIITIKPGYSWVLNPKRDVKHVNRFHGRTWLVVYFKGALKDPARLEAAEMRDHFEGRFSICYLKSSLEVVTGCDLGQIDRQKISTLAEEAHLVSGQICPLAPVKISCKSGLSDPDLY
ncbi:MAG: hypothetical protein P8Z49_06710 [Acidobacteriota bacterium]